MYREYIYSADQEPGFYNELCGYVHEDTVLGKYWFLKFMDGEYKEALFMDLSLNKGDTMAIISDFRHMRADSVIVDSVYYVNDKKIVAIDKSHYDCYYGDKVKFIEGVGATNGFYMGEWWEQPEPYTLMCKFENDIKTYSIDKEWFIDCFHDGGGGIHDSEFGNNISIYPNPSQGKICITIENFNSKLSYTLFNSLGQIISEGDLLENSNELDLHEQGLFFIKISDDKYQTTKKIINYNH